jgi:phosphopantothenoylcysteine synthetase/decarboxylase
MNILLGITGSISAYKACDIISGLNATGHDVKVIMTEDAKNFITEMSLSIISGREVVSKFSTEVTGQVEHIDLAEWGEMLLIAPATANTIAKLANGICDNVLTATALAFRGKFKILAPAMNTLMYDHKTTKGNLKKLGGKFSEKNVWHIIEPDEGLLACGETGVGKLRKPRRIVEIINKLVTLKEEI